MKIQIFYVNAFSQIPFRGNTAAVCILDEVIPDDLMLKIASEVMVYGTAFVTPISDLKCWQNGNQFQLRYFAPTREISLCGFATLSTAGIMFEIFKNKNTELLFQTPAGQIICKRNDNGITMDLPIGVPQNLYDTEFAKIKGVDELIKLFVPENIEEVLFNKERRKLLIVWKSEVEKHIFEQFQPDMQKMVAVYPNPEDELYSVILSIKGNGNFTNPNGVHYDFVSRTFCPWLGIPEDNVTGSSHSVLAPYWGRVLNQTKFFARQCSKRGGELLLTVKDNAVSIGGNVFVIMESTMNVANWNSSF